MDKEQWVRLLHQRSSREGYWKSLKKKKKKIFFWYKAEAGMATAKFQRWVATQV